MLDLDPLYYAVYDESTIVVKRLIWLNELVSERNGQGIHQLRIAPYPP